MTIGCVSNNSEVCRTADDIDECTVSNIIGAESIAVRMTSVSIDPNIGGLLLLCVDIGEESREAIIYFDMLPTMFGQSLTVT